MIVFYYRVMNDRKSSKKQRAFIISQLVWVGNEDTALQWLLCHVSWVTIKLSPSCKSHQVAHLL